MNRTRRRREARRFADLLELVVVRVRCGKTLRQAVHGLPAAVPEGPLLEAWRGVREAVEEGRIGTEAAVGALLQRLQLEERAESLLERATAPVSGQARLAAALTVLFLAAAFLLFPPALRPGPSTLAASALLAGAGFGLQRLLLARSRRALWMSDWVRLLGLWKSRLAWGSTSAGALEALRSEKLFEPLPAPLREGLESLAGCLRDGSEHFEIAEVSEGEPAARFAREQLEALARLALEGLPLAELLSSFADSAEARFRRQAEETAERLKTQALAPLLLCHFPSFAVLWMAPLLGGLVGLDGG